jgi:hypothetical protein
MFMLCLFEIQLCKLQFQCPSYANVIVTIWHHNWALIMLHAWCCTSSCVVPLVVSMLHLLVMITFSAFYAPNVLWQSNLTIDGQRGCLEIICGFWQVALYLDKFGSICQGMLHDCKLNFIQIVSDHDLFLELPGRDPTERLVFLPIWS